MNKTNLKEDNNSLMMPKSLLDGLFPKKGIDEEIFTTIENFFEFFKKHSTLEICLGEQASCFRSTALGEILFCNTNFLYSIDINYRKVVKLRNIEIRTFWVIENLSPLFYNNPSFPQSTFLWTNRCAYWVLVETSDHLYLVSPNAIKIYNNTIGHIQKLIGRITNPSKNYATLVCLSTANKFISFKLEKTISILSIIDASIYRNTLAFISLKTHFLLVSLKGCTFIDIDLKEQIKNFSLELQETFKLNVSKLSTLYYLRKTFALAVVSKRELIIANIESSILKSQAFGNKIIIDIDSDFESVIFEVSGVLFFAPSIYNIEKNYELGIFSNILYTNRKCIIHRQGKIFLKEFKTNSIYEISSKENPFNNRSSNNLWRDLALPALITSHQMKNFIDAQNYFKEKVDIIQVCCLYDCIAVLGENFIDLYKLDNLTLLQSFGDKIHDDINFLIEKNSLSPSSHPVCVQEGSFYLRKYFFQKGLLLFILFLDSNESFLYQLEDAYDTIFANNDFSAFINGNFLLKFRGGLYIPLAIDMKIKDSDAYKIFPSLDRRHIILLHERNGKALNPLTIYSFITFEKLWSYNIFNSPLKPFVGIKFIFYKAVDDFCYFETDDTYFLFDNRKRLNIEDYNCAKALLLMKNENQIGDLKNLLKAYHSSIILKAYFHPLIFSMYNIYHYQADVLSYIEYPRNIFGVSPLLAASKLSYASAANDILLRLLNHEFKKYGALPNEEFKSLLRLESDLGLELLQRIIQPLKTFEAGFRQALSTRVHIPRKTKIISSSSTKFYPTLYNQLIKSHVFIIPMGYYRLTFPLEYIDSRNNQVTTFYRKIYFIGKFKNKKDYATTILRKIDKGEFYEDNNIADFEKIKAVFYRFNAEADLEFSTKSSFLFLKRFKETKNYGFVLSPYRYIIDSKWATLKYICISHSLIFMLNVIFVTLYVLNISALIFLILSLSLSVFLLLLEFSVMIMDFGDYFSDYENYFDIAGLFLSIVCFALSLHLASSYATLLAYFQIFTLIVLYFRFFTLMKVIPGLTHVMIMIFQLFWRIRYFMVICAFATISFGVIYARTIVEPDFYVWISFTFYSLFGENSSMPLTWFMQWIVVVIIGIVMNLIFFNMIIAHMSNVYNELDKIKEVLIYQYRCKLIHECENRFRFLLRLLTYCGLYYRELEGTGSNVFIKEKPHVLTYIASNNTRDILKNYNEHQLQTKLQANRKECEILLSEIEEAKKETKLMQQNIVDYSRNFNQQIRLFYRHSSTYRILR